MSEKNHHPELGTYLNTAVGNVNDAYRGDRLELRLTNNPSQLNNNIWKIAAISPYKPEITSLQRNLKFAFQLEQDDQEEALTLLKEQFTDGCDAETSLFLTHLLIARTAMSPSDITHEEDKLSKTVNDMREELCLEPLGNPGKEDRKLIEPNLIDLNQVIEAVLTQKLQVRQDLSPDDNQPSLFPLMPR